MKQDTYYIRYTINDKFTIYMSNTDLTKEFLVYNSNCNIAELRQEGIAWEEYSWEDFSLYDNIDILTPEEYESIIFIETI